MGYFIILLSLLSFFTLTLSVENTHFINKLSKVKSFDEKEWYLENIPFVEIPDHSIEEIYYYRWSTHKRHLRYLTIGAGFSVTEFVHDVNYSKKYGVLNDAAGHHIFESRWLRNLRFVQVSILLPRSNQLDYPN